MARLSQRVRSVRVARGLLASIVWLLPGLAPLRAGDGPPDPAPSRFAGEIEKFERANQDDPPEPGSVLFLGSSSIKLWDLDAWFPDRGLVNRGFGGSQLSDVIHYADRLVAPVRPRLVFVYAGDNDIAAGKSPDRVLGDFLALVDRVRAASPEAKVVFLAIKPSIARKDDWPSMRRANTLVREACERGDHLAFLDVATPMLTPQGGLRPELYVADGLHLSREGYAIWAETLAPMLTQPGDGPSGP
ncbi:SGNH/GDSL hydrolase family protein [Tautonia sp. JC769]|uniref:SGNH/GDSL hydrolase family protein n=1 Tax=Tautonia sp. JC769 TaxID=3232135 RepID=UPI00345AB946